MAVLSEPSSDEGMGRMEHWPGVGGGGGGCLSTSYRQRDRGTA